MTWHRRVLNIRPFLLMIGLVVGGSAQAGTIYDNLADGTDSGTGIYGGGLVKYSAFSTDGNNSDLSSVTLSLELDGGGPADTIDVSLYSVDIHAQAEFLASVGSIAASTLSFDAFGDYTFTAPAGISLAPDTTYEIGVTDASNPVFTGVALWQVAGDGSELMRVDVSNSETPEPTTLLLVLGGFLSLKVLLPGKPHCRM